MMKQEYEVEDLVSCRLGSYKKKQARRSLISNQKAKLNVLSDEERERAAKLRG